MANHSNADSALWQVVVISAVCAVIAVTVLRTVFFALPFILGAAFPIWFMSLTAKS